MMVPKMSVSCTVRAGRCDAVLLGMLWAASVLPESFKLAQRPHPIFFSRSGRCSRLRAATVAFAFARAATVAFAFARAATVAVAVVFDVAFDVNPR